MQIKLYRIMHNDLDAHYTLEYTGDEVNEGAALFVLQQAKQRFKISGRTFILVTDQDSFFITKADKQWKSYKLERASDERELETGV